MEDPKLAAVDASKATLPAGEKPKRNRYAIALTMLSSMASILLGYDYGVMSGAMIFIKEDLKLNNTEVEVALGILNIYSLLGSTLAGRTSDWIGRRYTIVCAAVIFFVGAIMMGLAPNYAFLMVGRFVAGVGVGYALMIAPCYTAEVAPASCRGFLTSFPEVFINFGIMVGYVANYAFSGLPINLNWRLMLGVGAIPSVMLGVGILIMPESPRWLVLQGRLKDAREVLARTSDSKEEAELRLLEIKEAAGIPVECNDDVVHVPKRDRGHNIWGVWKELLITPTPTVRRILIGVIGIQFLQQASGVDVAVLYGPTIFEKAGIKSKSGILGANVAIGFSKTACILVSTFFLDKVGRRPLLLASSFGMVVSLLGLGTGLTVVEHSRDEKVMWAVVLCIITVLSFVGTFSAGLGPINWVYAAEILPLKLRAQGLSIGVVVNRTASGVIAMTYLSLVHALSMGGTFYLFAGIAAFSFIFFYTYLPETRGRSLEEMEVLFEEPTWVWLRKSRDRHAGNANGHADTRPEKSIALASSAPGATNGRDATKQDQAPPV